MNDLHQDYISAIMNQSMLENQIPEINNSEKLKLTSRQRRILEVVNQGKPLNELAYELGTSLDAAELLEDIAVRLNHRLHINHQPEKQQDQQQPQQLQTKEAHNLIDNELLTPRQCEVLRLVANGLTTKEIAKSLFNKC